MATSNVYLGAVAKISIAVLATLSTQISNARLSVGGGCEIYTSSVGSQSGILEECITTALDSLPGSTPPNPGTVYGANSSPVVAGVGASYSALAEYGRLGIALGSIATADIFSSAHEWFDAYAYSRSGASFSDQMIVRSNSSSASESTFIKVSGYLDAVFNERLAGQSFFDNSFTNVEFSISVNFPSANTQNSVVFSYFPNSSFSTAIPVSRASRFYNYDLLFEVPVDQPFTLTTSFNGRLYAVAQSRDVRPDPTFSFAEIGVNALNTARTFVDVTDPSLTLVADSGHIYSSPAPIPEAETYALMLAGLVFVGVAARRRKAA